MADRPPAQQADDLDEPLDPLTETALAWLVRLHAGDATAEDWSAYRGWRQQGPDYERAAAAAEELWRSLGPAALRAPRRSRRKRLAAAAILGLGLFVAATGMGFDPPMAWFATYRTATGERETFNLPDGSRLELNTATSVDIDFAGATRRLILYKGEIHVTVRSDPGRAFEVKAADGTIRALGTAFGVRRDGGAVRVTVTEHAVRVTYPDRSDGTTTDVSAGEQVSYAPGAGLGTPARVDLRALTAWRRGHLVFDGVPLGAVAAELGRYQRGIIVIRDPALRELPVTGVFDTGSAQDLVDALTLTLPIQVRRFPWLVMIEPDAPRH
jgi:transmembrane sensor